MKVSILGSLALCALVSPALASPLEARDNKRTVTVTETDVSTKYRTTTATVTETDTIRQIKTKTETETVTSSTTVTIRRPTTIVSTDTSTTTKIIQKTVQGPTVTSVSTVKASTVTAPGKTVTSLSTTTMPAQTVTAPGKTIISTIPGKTVTSLSTTTMPAQTVTASGKTVTSLSTKVIPGTTITAPGTTAYVTSISTVPGPTITERLTTTAPGSTVTAVSTSYINNGGNGTYITLSKTFTTWLASACASSTSSSAAATTSAVTNSCANPTVSNSGFETGSLSGWTVYNPIGGEGGQWSVVSNGDDSSYAAQVTMLNPNTSKYGGFAGYISQNVGTCSGSSYTVSFNYNCAVVDNGLAIYAYAGSGHIDQFNCPTDQAWHSASFTFTASGSSTSVLVESVQNGVTQGTILFDNILVTLNE